MEIQIRNHNNSANSGRAVRLLQVGARPILPNRPLRGSHEEVQLPVGSDRITVGSLHVSNGKSWREQYETLVF